ncbi:excisionase [Butyrivibrio sp. WCD3002]|uniref:excisionase n=1 Tax=Butyrivibrio sp. WCD3002 TaxID=1280676 RepID=UPI00047D025D|nr:excisionase [Butyrivibrio sp. WCD3002]
MERVEKYEIRLCERPTLTVEEAAALYNIGENKLRDLTDQDSCPYVLFVGRKRLIKRKQFDDYIGKAFSI